MRPPKGSPVVSVRVNRRQELPSSSSQPPPNTLDVPGASKARHCSTGHRFAQIIRDSGLGSYSKFTAFLSSNSFRCGLSLSRVNVHI